MMLTLWDKQAAQKSHAAAAPPEEGERRTRRGVETYFWLNQQNCKLITVGKHNLCVSVQSETVLLYIFSLLMVHFSC